MDLKETDGSHTATWNLFSHFITDVFAIAKIACVPVSDVCEFLSSEQKNFLQAPETC